MPVRHFGRLIATFRGAIATAFDLEAIRRSCHLARRWQSRGFTFRLKTGSARMQPILFEIPGFGVKIHSYGVMILLACFAALAMSVWRARREKIDSNVVYELATWLFLGGVIGARGMYVILHPETIHSIGDIFRSWKGGNVFYGCILGGLTGSLLYWCRRPYPLWTMIDVAAPAVAIGAAVGRIGCFLNGCCDGAICSLPWGVRFPAGSHAWMRQANAGLISEGSPFSLPVHPTQLYASVAAIAVLVLLLAYFRRRGRPGEVMALLMIFYSLTRWPIEALRADERARFAGMTSAQLISAFLVITGLALWIYLRFSAPVVAKRSDLLQPELSTEPKRADSAHSAGALTAQRNVTAPPSSRIDGARSFWKPRTG
jgi:phosphatidylglycerol:prolipoprotein diacylglycerol transferase